MEFANSLLYMPGGGLAQQKGGQHRDGHETAARNASIFPPYPATNLTHHYNNNARALPPPIHNLPSPLFPGETPLVCIPPRTCKAPNWKASPRCACPPCCSG